MINYAKAKPTTVTLTKGGSPVRLAKTPLITAAASWRSGTDYDVYALVLLADGSVIHVATFPADGVPAHPSHPCGVRHCGDVGRAEVAAAGVATETLEIRLSDQIRAVVPVAYSAQSNGTGSFHRYQVSLTVDNGAGQRVIVPADHANNDDRVYTCVPAIIHNLPDGVLVERVELYSKRGSESRPAVCVDQAGRVLVAMDRGPRNAYK
jgi:tellurite resistance protein TerA